MRIIDADVLYKQVAESEEKARDRFLDTSSSLPCPSYINPAYTRYNEQLNERTRLKHMIADAPTIDAVEVVRCKDCKWFGEIGCAIRIVDDSDKPKEDDYCSFAERRTDETD